MNKLFVLLFCLLLFTTASINLLSNENRENSKFGIYGGFNLNNHSADFSKLPGIPNCCPRFESGSGSGIAAGLLYDLPLSKMFTFTARAIYSDFSADLEADQQTSITVDAAVVPATISHQLSSKIASINFEPIIGINILPEFRLFVGASAGFIISSTFEQEERLVEPSGSTFENGLRVRNMQNGDIPESSSTAISALAGMSYELPLNKNRSLLLAPEISYYYGLSQVISDYTWSANTLRVGIALKYDPFISSPKTKEIFEQREMIDTVEVKVKDITETTIRIGIPSITIDTTFAKNEIRILETTKRTDSSFIAIPYVLNATVKAVSVGQDGSEKDLNLVKVEEFLSTNMIPLLNYVFFEDNSSTLPDRYIKLNENQTKEFNKNELFEYKTLDAYQNVLNIIGKRMQVNPRAKITITGCNSDAGNEKGNKNLSGERAYSIKNYLTYVWNISEKRIKTVSRNLPVKPSNAKYRDGIEENRRAEISSGSWNILEPIVMKDTLRTASPGIIKFNTTLNSDENIKSWKLLIAQKGNVIKEINGDVLPETIEWNIDDDKQGIPRLESEISYTLQITDVKGKSFETEVQKLTVNQITVDRKREEKIVDKRIDKYSLILFDFNESKLNKANQKITTFVKSNISSGSTVLIEGYTDRTGEAAYNQQLSSERAENVRKTLNKGNIFSKGSGSSRLIYDNNLPEGRFYCRTVTISVETPISK